jgi:hypothetical protein
MSNHRIRNLIPPIYALLILIGFIISATVGVVVVIAGGVLSGILWSRLSGGPDAHSHRAAARAQRRAGRRAQRGSSRS